MEGANGHQATVDSESCRYNGLSRLHRAGFIVAFTRIV
jgi:hypothetical protein